MDHRFKSYLRPLRRRWGFTQHELAYLLGVASRTIISRVEGGKRTPSLAAALALSIVFDATQPQLFPGVISSVQESVLRGANELYEALQGDPSKATRIKLDFLEEVIARVEEQRPNKTI